MHGITIVLRTGVRLTIISKMFGLMCWHLVSSVVIQITVGAWVSYRFSNPKCGTDWDYHIIVLDWTGWDFHIIDWTDWDFHIIEGHVAFINA